MSLSRLELENLLKTAEEAATAAGDFLLKNKNTEIGMEVKESKGHDIKISADKLSEDIIIQILKKTDFPILTEESGFLAKTGTDKTDNLRWAVDPIDGSLNYFRQIPLCCVSIGLWSNHQPILGTVYDFNRNELFSGISRVGAWLNKKNIEPSKVSDINQSVLCTGFPVNTDFSPFALGKFIDQIRLYKKIRLIGSAALSLAYVAAGRADAYMENGIMLWDIAGGLAVLSGAGGKLKIEETKKENSFNVIASTPHLN